MKPETRDLINRFEAAVKVLEESFRAVDDRTDALIERTEQLRGTLQWKEPRT